MKRLSELTEAFGFESSKPNKHDFSKEAIALMKKVEKATGWSGGRDVTDSGSDLIRLAWDLRMSKQLDRKSLAALSKLDIMRITMTKAGIEVSVQK